MFLSISVFTNKERRRDAAVRPLPGVLLPNFMQDQKPLVQTQEKQQKKEKHLWKKGESGNPNGRPKGSVSITTEIKARMLKVFPEKSAKITTEDGKKIKKIKKPYLQKIIETIFDNAIVQKDTRTLNQIWAYIDGHPKATLDIGADKQSLEDLTRFFKMTAQEKKDE